MCLRLSRSNSLLGVGHGCSGIVAALQPILFMTAKHPIGTTWPEHLGRATADSYLTVETLMESAQWAGVRAPTSERSEEAGVTRTQSLERDTSTGG